MLLQCLQRRTEPRLQITCTENFVKFGQDMFEKCERTDRHTDTLSAILRTQRNKTNLFAVTVNALEVTVLHMWNFRCGVLLLLTF